MNSRMRWPAVIFSIGLLLSGVEACGGNGGNHAGGGDDGGSADGTLGDGQGPGDGKASDVQGFGDAPTTGDGGVTTSCLGPGGACASTADCCSGTCANGFCNVPACTSDHAACSTNGQCCSQNCTAGACVPLDTTCETLGNQCTQSSQCCSNLCSSGTCQPSSFCIEPGDACTLDSDCCTGTCTKIAGQTAGVCGASAPGGPANCGLVDGQLCGGSAPDGGIVVSDAGVPSCGGPCCSRACAPWGPTGVLVCQPASGCKVVGDLCTTDGDCCGSAGLPGGSNKPVTCIITPPATVGVCRNPNGCKPDGDVCKLQTSSCNSSCDCCSGNCETQDTCKQDNEGVPRCAGAQCVNPADPARRAPTAAMAARAFPTPAARPPSFAPGRAASGPAVNAPTTRTAARAPRACFRREPRTACAGRAWAGPTAALAPMGEAEATTAEPGARTRAARSTGSSARRAPTAAMACRARTVAASPRSSRLSKPRARERGPRSRRRLTGSGQPQACRPMSRRATLEVCLVTRAWDGLAAPARGGAPRAPRRRRRPPSSATLRARA